MPNLSLSFNLGMRSICLILLCAMCCAEATAQLVFEQQPMSYYGQAHTPKGRLHMLVIFVRYIDYDSSPNDALWGNTDALPSIGAGDCNAFFCKDTLFSDARNNLTSYYYAMSGGKFWLTGEAFPVQVPVKYIPPNSGNFYTRQEQMNRAAVEWIAQHYPAFDWSRFDSRKNAPNYTYDNSRSRPDSILDYVLFAHRNLNGSNGISSPGGITIPNTPFRIASGHTAINSFADAEHNFGFFTHELAHNLFSAPHYAGANGADGNRFYTQMGWGMMSHWHPPFSVANAWEAWWLDWLQPQTITRNGVYLLRDYLTARDALRIQLPATEQYLWLENHQQRSAWDKKLFFVGQDNLQESAKGVYMYVVGEAGSLREKPNLGAFNRNHSNMIRMMHGRGNADFAPRGDSLKTRYMRNPVLVNRGNNPFSGQNPFQQIRWDMNGDGSVTPAMSHGNNDSKNRDMIDFFVEERNGVATYTAAQTGDSTAAFNAGAEVGLSGIVPAANFPFYDKGKQELAPYVLNGISIRILRYLPDGTAELRIALDDFAVRTAQRWCGNLLIPSPNTPAYRDWTITAPLRIDVSRTPARETKHPKTNFWANPTTLDVQQQNRLVLKRGAKMLLTENSELFLRGNAQIVVERGAELLIEAGGTLWLEEKSALIIKRGGTVRIKNTGLLRKMHDTNIILYGGGTFDDQRYK